MWMEFVVVPCRIVICPTVTARRNVPTTLNKKSRASVCTIPAQVLKGIVLEGH